MKCYEIYSSGRQCNYQCEDCKNIEFEKFAVNFKKEQEFLKLDSYMQQNYNKLFGEFLGYPDCCIKEFGDYPIVFNNRHPLIQKHSKDGFVPCLHCANLLEQKAINHYELINTPKRKSSVIFPCMSYLDRTMLDQELKALVDFNENLIKK